MAKPNLHSISIEKLKNFQLDDESRLYRNDERVRLLSRIELPDWTLAGILVALSRAASALVDMIRLFRGM